MNGAIVLLSGGQDSTTMLFFAKKIFAEMWARRQRAGAAEIVTVSFDYGQRHRIELERAKKISEMAGAHEHHVIRIGGLATAIPSALTSNDAIATRPDGLPTTFVPGRNAIFLSIAAGMAKARGFNTVFIGCSQVDYSGYPDCRGGFLDDMTSALMKAIADDDFDIVSPFLAYTKAETVQLARSLGADCWSALGLSWTCYDPVERREVPPGMDVWHVPCRRCPACVLRAKGFAEACEIDPAWLPRVSP